MVKETESTLNKYDDPNDPPAFTLSSTIYTQLFDDNPDRVGYRISNDSNKSIFIKERAFDDPDDNVIRGFWIPARTPWESDSGKIVTGPISAIAVSGSPTIVAQEE